MSSRIHGQYTVYSTRWKNLVPVNYSRAALTSDCLSPGVHHIRWYLLLAAAGPKSDTENIYRVVKITLHS